MMNEHKIRLIADEATEWCKHHAHGTPTAWEWEYKFAELIIEECCVALNPMLRDMISRGQGVDTIKRHFGVDDENSN